MSEKQTYKEILAALSPSEREELLHRKLDVIMQGIEYLWNKRDAQNVVSPELQIPIYPQPNVIIYETPNASGHPPFYADDPEYIAEGWPWPDVPPAPPGEASPEES